MNSLLTLCLLIVAFCVCSCGQSYRSPASADSVERAFKERMSDVPVTGAGSVARILADDRTGLEHQRFIVMLASGQTLLIEHNIDVAKRIDDLKAGDQIEFSGEYVWNEQGGLVHWTHHDPNGRHADGWIKHNGMIYQ